MPEVTLNELEWDVLEHWLRHFLIIRQGGPEYPQVRSLVRKLEALRCTPQGRASDGSTPLTPDIYGGEESRRRETNMARVITPKRRTAPQPPKPFDAEDEPVNEVEYDEEEEELVEQAAPRRRTAAAQAAAKEASTKPKATRKPKATKAAKSEAPAVKPVKRAPKSGDEPLSPEELIERKKLAGAGRSSEPGTTFGSRWTDDEREELRELTESMSGADAAAAFVKKNPHRTVQGALYQISRHGL